MNNVGKNWEKDEEEKLIGEINKLVSIDKIAEKHQRYIGGVRARIKKILEDPIKSNKITDKAQVVIKYLAENEEKIQLSKEEYVQALKNIKTNIYKYNNISEIITENNINEYYAKKILEKISENNDDNKFVKKINTLLNQKDIKDNKDNKDNKNNKITILDKPNNSNEPANLIINHILDFYSVFTIKKVFTNLEIDEIREILKKYLLIENPNQEKKNKIKFILKKYKFSKEEDLDDKEFDTEKIKKKIFAINLANINQQKNNIVNNINNIDKTNNSISGFTGLNTNIINIENNQIQKILKSLNELTNQVKSIKNDLNNLNTKIDFVYKNICYNNNDNNNLIEQSEEELEKELCQFI